MRKQFNANQIADIVMTLNGQVEPVGETNIDNRNFENLIELQSVIEILVKEIYCIVCYADSSLYSMERAGKQAIQGLHELYEFLRDIFDNDGDVDSEDK